MSTSSTAGLIFMFYFATISLASSADSFKISLTGNKSYLVMPSWQPCENSSVVFEFHSTDPYGLLLYTEFLEVNPVPYTKTNHFLHLSLVDGRVALKLNVQKSDSGDTTVADTVSSIHLGSNLHKNDGYNRVELLLSRGFAILRVNELKEQLTFPKHLKQIFKVSTSSHVYFGGLKPLMTKDAQQRAYFGVTFETNFRGEFRNILYSNCSTISRKFYAPELLDSRDSKLRKLPSCSSADGHCQNGGLCLIGENNRPFCFCTYEFTGTRCEKLRNEVPTTFTGQGFIYLDINSEKFPLHGSSDTFSLLYRTRQHSAFLMYAGAKDAAHMMTSDGSSSSDYISIGIKNRQLFIQMSIGGKARTKFIPPPQQILDRFTDSNWHRLQVKRRFEKWKGPSWQPRIVVEVIFDDKVLEEFNIEHSGSLVSKTLYLGGYKTSLPGSRDMPAFIGCLREATFRSDNAFIDLLMYARDGQHGIQAVNMPRSNFDVCIDPHVLQPVSFFNPETYLAVSRDLTNIWTQLTNTVTSLSFRFMSNERNGLLLYVGSNRSDFVGLELRDGNLYFLIDAGAGTVQKKVTGNRNQLYVTQMNRIWFSNNPSKRFIQLNDDRKLFLNGPKFDKFFKLDLSGKFYLGGIPRSKRFTVPPELHTATLNQGFVGAISNLTVNGEGIDLVYEVLKQRKQDIIGVTESVPRLKECHTNPCSHGAQCSNGWNRFICDCSRTQFTGKSCSKKAPILKFDGSGDMKISFLTTLRSMVENVVLRFRTKQSDGLLMATRDARRGSKDTFKLFVSRGRLVCVVNFGTSDQRLETDFVNDGLWHTVVVKRRSSTLKLYLDSKPEFTKNLNPTVGNAPLMLVVKTIYIGVVKPGNYKLLETTEIAVGTPASYFNRSDQSFFVGNMMHFSFNGINYFEQALMNDSSTTVQVTAAVDESQVEVLKPFTIRTPFSYAEMPPLKLYGNFSIHFYFKTTQSNGVILFNTGGYSRTSDYFLLELVEGQMHLSFNTGTQPIERLLPPGRQLHDNQWHKVEVHRTEMNRVIFRVDSQPSGSLASLQNPAQDTAGLNVDVNNNNVFIGGAAADLLSRRSDAIKSKVGFQGCLGSVYLYPEQSLPVDIVRNRKNKELFAGDITSSCSKPRVECRPDVCYNGGQCIQQWHRVTCNCDYTSFTGTWCNKIGLATFRFGRNGKIGRLEFEYTDQNFLPTTKRDELSFGFQTEKVSGVLMYIRAKQAFSDYILVEISNRKVSVRYNMKSREIRLINNQVDVSDNRYHRIRFLREEDRGTLYIDDYRAVISQGGADFGTSFNDQKFIQVGSITLDEQKDVKNAALRTSQQRARLSRIRRSSEEMWTHFEGVLTGMVFNGIHLTKVAANDEEAKNLVNLKVTRIGEVDVIRNFSPNMVGYPQADRPDYYLNPDMMLATGPAAQTTVPGIIVTRIKCPPSGVNRADCVNSGGIIHSDYRDVTTRQPTATRSPSINSPSNVHDQENKLKDKQDESNNIRKVDDKSSLEPKIGSAKIDIYIIVAVAAGGAVVLLLFICLIYRCRRKDEGSYRVDETQNFEDPALKPLRGNPYTNGDIKTKAATKKRDAKEWYV